MNVQHNLMMFDHMPTTRDRVIALLRAGGHTAGQIAHSLGTSPAYVHRVARETGLTPQPCRSGPATVQERQDQGPDARVIAQAIYKARQALGVSAYEFARAADIGGQRLVGLESAMVDATLSDLKRLRAAGVNVRVVAG